MSYIFGGSSTPQTYDDVQERRRIARQLLAANARTPQTFGDGLASVGRAIAARRNMNQAEKGGAILQGEFDAQMQALMGGMSGAPMGGVTPSSRSYAPTGAAERNTAGVASAVAGSGAPTAGLPHMLPDADPDLNDPRRAQFATAAPRVDDPTAYTTQMQGRLQGVDPAIVDIVGNSVEQAYGPGATVDVTSGLRPNSQGSQHSAGQALDFGVTDFDGATSDYSDPRIFDAARVAVSDGASGIGIGPNYMGGQRFHFDTGQGGNGAPRFDNARAWSDWNTGDTRRQFGRGNQDAGGAGDPRFGFRAELQDIRDGRRVVPGEQPQGGQASPMAQYRDAIASVESAGSGGYAAIGPQHSALGRPLGRYQVMEANLPEWSRAALGREVAPGEFLANPQIQDAIFDHRFGGYVEQYGPEAAARAWFSGEGGMNNMGASDSLGTSNAEYTRRFANALGDAPAMTATMSAQNAPAMPQGGMPTAATDPKLAEYAQSMQIGGDPMSRLAAMGNLMGNQMASPGQQMVLQALMQQEMGRMQPPNPMDALRQRQMELEIAQMEQALANPAGPDDPASFVALQRRATEAGLVPGTPEYQDFMAQGGGSAPLVQIMGDQPGRYLYGSDAGVPAGWRVDTQTGEASPIPGGPVDVEVRRNQEAEARGQDQSELMMGTTLQSLNLNIAEIEDGGLPVTGGGGDLRRTNVGRFLTGSDAVDFGNRTSQITDSAALAEIQRMRDNSPTGGAVGQLTDSERVAIGNAVTAINASTSAEEYLRAARAYRELALDLSYGQGNWTLSEDGSVVRRDNAPSQPAAPAPEGSIYQDRQSFISDFGVIAAASAAGTTPQAMWEILQSQGASQ